jgi:predicted metal-dependent phosphoesterase TrpH
MRPNNAMLQPIWDAAYGSAYTAILAHSIKYAERLDKYRVAKQAAKIADEAVEQFRQLRKEEDGTG